MFVCLMMVLTPVGCVRVTVDVNMEVVESFLGIRIRRIKIRIQFNSQVVYTTRNLLWWMGAYSKHISILKVCAVFKYKKYEMFFLFIYIYI